MVFIPKCRRETLYAQLRRYLGEVFRKLAEQKESRIEVGAFDARACAHDDIHPTEIRRVASDRLHQGEKPDTPRTGIWGDPAEFRRAELLGTRVFCVEGWPGLCIPSSASDFAT